MKISLSYQCEDELLKNQLLQNFVGNNLFEAYRIDQGRKQSLCRQHFLFAQFHSLEIRIRSTNDDQMKRSNASTISLGNTSSKIGALSFTSSISIFATTST